MELWLINQGWPAWHGTMSTEVYICTTVSKWSYTWIYITALLVGGRSTSPTLGLMTNEQRKWPSDTGMDIEVDVKASCITAVPALAATWCAQLGQAAVIRLGP